MVGKNKKEKNTINHGKLLKNIIIHNIDVFVKTNDRTEIFISSKL